MEYFKLLGPLIRLLPPETAHRLGQLALKLPISLVSKPVSDPFTWRSIEFRNRVGLAAGFDKDAETLVGEANLGFGFLEFGTVLIQSHTGNAIRPRLVRLPRESAIWNCLGFPSKGAPEVVINLRRSHGSLPTNVPLAANIGPHPLHLKQAPSESQCLQIVLQELTELAAALAPYCSMFVVNLSSPNTPVLRSLLHQPQIGEQVFAPLQRHLSSIADSTSSPRRPLLLKLPPEDLERRGWTDSSMQKLLDPLLQLGVIDGVVATNTSSQLSSELYPKAPPTLPGGVSGGPLLARSLATLQIVKNILPSDCLLIGCGGVSSADDALRLMNTGADLIQMYTGLVYQGPHLITSAAEALRSAKHQGSIG